jgi:uncharacterized membrane protein
MENGHDAPSQSQTCIVTAKNHAIFVLASSVFLRLICSSPSSSFMNAAHLHLLINHAPIFSLIIGLVVLAVGLLRKELPLKMTGLVLIMFAAITTLPVNASGEEAEEVVEKMANRSHDLIHEHEEAAETAIWLMLLTGGLATGALVMLRRSHQRAHLLTSVTLGLGVLVMIWMMQVANLGGRISHPEIRPGYQSPTGQPIEEDLDGSLEEEASEADDD